MAPPSPIARLGEELAKVREFITLLKREQELLARADTDSLLPLVATKSDLSLQLADLSKSRESALQQRQLPAGRAGIDLWFDQGGTPADRHNWQQLLELAAQARALNETNGKLINLHMQHNQQAFNVLMVAANRAMIYGPDGQQKPGTGGRILGTA